MSDEPGIPTCVKKWTKDIVYLGLFLAFLSLILLIIYKISVYAMFKYDVYIKTENFKGYSQDYILNAYKRKPVLENINGGFWSRSGSFNNKTGYYSRCLNCVNTTNPTIRRYCKNSTTKWCPLSLDMPNV